MSIRPIDLNGMIQRTQDVGTIKHQEDVKPNVDQQNIQREVAKDGNRLVTQVNKKDDPEEQETHYDAKEKGNSEYKGNSKNKKSKEQKSPGKVVVKGMSGGFDIKI